MGDVEPLMGPESYKTYAVHAPLSTHFRPATCEEVDCPHYIHGWRTRVEGLPPDLLHAARTSGRHYREVQLAEGETWMEFSAGQSCFQVSKHRKRIEKPELYIVRDGDLRGNPRGTKARLHQRPADWQDDFANHQQALADAQARG